MKQDSFKEFVLEQLEGLGPVSARSMFGGAGLYCRETFFGILFEGTLYFKTNGRTRSPYEERGMKSFRPSARQTLKNYYEVPPEVLEDREELVLWARDAVEVSGGK